MIKSVRRKSITIAFSFIIIFLIWLCADVYLSNKKDKNLRANWVLTSGELVTVKLKGKSADYTIYSYTVNKKVYTARYYPKTQSIYKLFAELKKGVYSVIYDSTDITNSTLLLRREDFSNWRIPYSRQEVIDFTSTN